MRSDGNAGALAPSNTVESFKSRKAPPVNPSESAFTEAVALVAQGAKLHFPGRNPPFALGAIAWIPGRGLLAAELWAEHQGHVHLFPATHLESDGPGGVDVMSDDKLVGTIIDLEDGKSDISAWRMKVRTKAWRDFWKSEIKAAAGT